MSTHENDKDHLLVLKLNKKIKETMEEDKLLKILTLISQINMSLDILQSTRVGHTVNQLRKMDGKVGEKAKELIKKWKKLIPNSSEKPQSDIKKIDTRNESSTRNKEKTKDIPASLSSSDPISHDNHAKTQTCLSVSPPTKRRANSKSTSSKQRYDILRQELDTISSTGSRSQPGSTINSLDDGNYIKQSHGDHVIQSHDSADQEGFDRRKRKGVNLGSDSEGVTVALTKRSRTQVYSGKSSSLKYVPSLFDQCMNILIDNIDAIEEVGGIPFFILEPVLVKCTPTQLMRLEEFNPHFVEDSDSLWEKHCQKEFRGAKPDSERTWKDLYIEKLAEREQKMKSITKSIRARQQARDEPVRKAAILSNAPLPPSRHRRSHAQFGNSFFKSGSGLNSSPGRSGKNLMKQTMQMAKTRHMMMSSRPGRK